MFQFNNKNRGFTRHLLRRKKEISLAYFKKGEGFTLIEVIIVILVVTVGVLAAYITTQEIVSYTHQISYRLTAAYLAKEGIEIVRNIRDTNWLESASWKEGLVAGDWEVAYSDQSLTFCPSPCDPDHNLRFLKIGGIGGGFYNYGIGTDSKFKREITITPIGDTLEVSVSVWWEEKSATSTPITAQEILYNWYPL